MGLRTWAIIANSSSDDRKLRNPYANGIGHLTPSMADSRQTQRIDEDTLVQPSWRLERSCPRLFHRVPGTALSTSLHPLATFPRVDLLPVNSVTLKRDYSASNRLSTPRIGHDETRSSEPRRVTATTPRNVENLPSKRIFVILCSSNSNDNSPVDFSLNPVMISIRFLPKTN
ncbi:predicted protein [Uncinocarpus reesii 1704]|uniref:Uncharacterized protein n=1 Tax=Uncinocarpus reesii (strain UAMH 1704) TaxID=336963 RepID=C4JVV6_UNCRE|nr:uncharacterized protein UREG_06698 [Uncinocarpus reesii 1704]EEP81833.1 predicted protein [Uncinocarpus reesii 1704]